ncbi:MAG TPA: nuclear transport factor 2 family protein [Chryseolinea sp.]|nr:nuclear transport factor 2 family protein [Chryseolinea sp.]
MINEIRRKNANSVANGALVLPLLVLIGVQFFDNKQIKSEQDMATVRTRYMVNEAAALDDEAAIRALEDKFAAAFNAGDIDGMMKNYIADESLVVFDVVPPRQHLGADAYHDAWVGFFAHFTGTPKIAISDLGITVDGNLGFSHSIQHVTGIDKQGHAVDRTVRVTDGYRKIGGKWLIVLEHVSVPVDLKTGRPDLSSKP